MEECLYATKKGEAHVQQLLAFARLQKLKPTTIELNKYIQETVSHLINALNDNIHLITDYEQYNQFVNVDTTMLSSAILNLVINAQHAMPKGGTLTIKTSHVKLNGETFTASEDTAFGEYALVTITDTGCGIAQENLIRVVEPFYTTKQAGKGSGLGLSMVCGFIKQSDGYLSIDSEPGKGTTVSLFLPTTSKNE